MSKKLRKEKESKAELGGKVIGYIILAIISPILGLVIAMKFIYRELTFQKKLLIIKMAFFTSKTRLLHSSLIYLILKKMMLFWIYVLHLEEKLLTLDSL